MNSHELLIEAQQYLTLARQFEKDGRPRSAQIARSIAIQLVNLTEEMEIV